MLFFLLGLISVLLSLPLLTVGTADLSLPAELGRVEPALVGRDLSGGWGMILVCQINAKQSIKYFNVF